MSSSNVKLPSVRLPKLTSVPRNPRGWNTSEIAIRSRGLTGANKLKRQEPAGDPPSNWTGTRPEWAIYWALTKKGLNDGVDFGFRSNLPGVEAGYYSQIDFYVYASAVGIEVQGTFWHMGVGTEKQYNDLLRKALFAQQGVNVIFIDEVDALSDPLFYVEEALEGNDHSEIGRAY